MNKKMKLPNVLFAKIETDSDGSQYIIAEDNQPDLLNRNEVIKVGVYKLVAINTATLAPHVSSTKKVIK
jgi:hypothetical protein